LNEEKQEAVTISDPEFLTEVRTLSLPIPVQFHCLICCPSVVLHCQQMMEAREEVEEADGHEELQKLLFVNR
jgi:hypothetical protein